MVVAAFRAGIFRAGKVSRNVFAPQQRANITGRATRGGPLKLQKPYPYREKKFTYWASFYDFAIDRLMEENAKLIVVEGPIAVGKTAFAKALAEEFDMLHIPEPTMDLYFTNHYGYNLRQLDPQLPYICRSFDHKDFCEKPNDVRVKFFQMRTMALKLVAYVDALCHILNTGQGVVLERSYYSDFAFLDAMYKHGYGINQAVYKYYHEVVEYPKPYLMRPHLVIYLDIPVPVVQQRIQQRGLSYELNSKVLTTSYLESLERTWKEKFLREISSHSYLLVYDWTEGGEVETVVEDIEKLDIESHVVSDDPMMMDWRYRGKESLRRRQLYTNELDLFLHYINKYPIDCPELLIDGDISDEADKVIENAPGMKYGKGYNAEMGDSKWSFIRNKPRLFRPANPFLPY